MDNPTRIQRKRTKGWKNPPNTVYVGRGSKWGNPFQVGSKTKIVVENKNKFRAAQEQTMILSPEMACLLYRERITNLIEQFGVPNIKELRGKNLACWCALDKPCHADVLLEIANNDRP